MARVIVTADDYGYCKTRDRGILQAFKDGIVTSAAIMGNSPHGREATTLASMAEMELLLHGNITEGCALTSTSQYKPSASEHKKPFPCFVSEVDIQHAQVYTSLTTEEGMFHSKSMVVNVLGGQAFLTQQFHEDVVDELTAQVAAFQQWTGATPVCINSHNHSCSVPTLAHAMTTVALARGIPAFRLAQLSSRKPESPSTSPFLLNVDRSSHKVAVTCLYLHRIFDAVSSGCYEKSPYVLY
eukprot:m.121946 g.121946  ORF g.121946 m.121946 type:complete len:241 (+) comp13712_c0_seq10:49-771(+)